MRDGGRLSAAIEILDQIDKYKQPPHKVLKEWGRTHRYAGSKDRAWIAGLVLDSIRHWASAGWAFEKDSSRSAVFWTYCQVWGFTPESLGRVLESDSYAPDPLLETEKTAFVREIKTADEWIQANIQAHWYDMLKPVWKEKCISLGQALSRRAEVCLRVNSLKADYEKLSASLKEYGGYPGYWSKTCLRLKQRPAWEKSPSLDHMKAWIKGWIEVQDEASQLAALSVNARAGEHILDYCAGAGGKSLAIAGDMQGKGQVYAYDRHKPRMKDIYQRIKKSGLHNIQIVENGLFELAGKMDKVIVDVPCSGSGVWRRRPETKWKLNQKNFQTRLKEQADILSEAKAYLRPGGQLIYMTCSVFNEENNGQISDFLKTEPEFRQINVMDNLNQNTQFIKMHSEKLKAKACHKNSLWLSPLTTHTDGFFIAVLQYQPR